MEFKKNHIKVLTKSARVEEELNSGMDWKVFLKKPETCKKGSQLRHWKISYQSRTSVCTKTLRHRYFKNQKLKSEKIITT